jgi:hypothetical protein
MSNSPGWYTQQAELYYQRAAECTRIADELEVAKLVDALDSAGDDTWQCPAADAFRQEVLIEQGNVLAAIEALRTNAYGLGHQGDNMSRRAAEVQRQQHEAARQQHEAARRHARAAGEAV